MQYANIMLALGGDPRNTVPKFGVSAAEIAVLRLLHGEESVRDVEPLPGEAPTDHRGERARLVDVYGKPDPTDGYRRCAAVDALFPGVAARVIERIDELDLPEEFFKAVMRATAHTSVPEVEPRTKRGRRKKAETADPLEGVEALSPEAIEREVANDGVEEMRDEWAVDAEPVDSVLD